MPETNGAAHFLEHMLFKGTERRSKKQLEAEIENLGASLNAYTSREHTVYLATAFKSDIDKVIDILSDVILHCSLTSKDMENERPVILREMEEVNKSPTEALFDHLHESVYGHHPLAMPILGTSHNVMMMKRRHLRHYVTQHYTANRMVLVAAGDVEHLTLVDAANERFARVEGPRQSARQRRPHFSPMHPRLLVRAPVDTAQTGAARALAEEHLGGRDAHLVIGYEGCSWTHEDTYPLMILQSLIGGCPEASTVPDPKDKQKQMSESEDFSYQTFNTCYTDSGIFGLVARTTNESGLVDLDVHLANKMGEIHRECTRERVECAKVDLEMQIRRLEESTGSAAEELGRQILFTPPVAPISDLADRILQVRHETVTRVAKKYLSQKHASVGIVSEDCSDIVLASSVFARNTTCVVRNH